MKRRIVFEILEQRRDRYARAAEDPGAAYATGIPFDSSAGGPVNHVGMVALRRLCLLHLESGLKFFCVSGKTPPESKISLTALL